MKMKQDHVVPLPDPAIAILERMRKSSQREPIFTNPEGGTFSEKRNAVLARLGSGHVTVHGFRSTFATWAEECSDHPDCVRTTKTIIRNISMGTLR
jgi:integrase